MYTSSAVRGGLLVIGFVAFLLLPLSLHAQPDDKDAEIARLKKQVQAQERMIESLKKERVVPEKLLEQILRLYGEIDSQALIAAKATKKLKKCEQDIIDLKGLIKLHEEYNERQEKNLRLANERVEEAKVRLAESTRRLEDWAVGREFCIDRLLKRVLAGGPALTADGKIEKTEDGLVQINVGTDDGVKKDQMLDVYRLKPEPRYVGVIRIVDANFSTSVARVIFGDAARFKLGDLVTSKLTKEEPKKK